MTTYSSDINGYYISVVATADAAAPVNSDTWLYVPHLGNEPLGHSPQADTSQEANRMGASTPPRQTVSGGSFVIKVLAHTGNLAMDGGAGDAAPGNFPNEVLLENYWGAEGSEGFAGTTVASGGPNSVVVTSATGIVVGMAVMFASGAIRVVKAISGSTLTLDQDLTTATDYDAAAAVYGGIFYKPTVGLYAPHIYITHVQDGIVDMLGPCRVTDFKTSMSEQKEIIFEFTLTGQHYYPRTGVTPSSIPVQTFTGTPLIATGGNCSVAGTNRAVKALAVQGCMTHVPQMTATTAGATDGVNGWYAPNCNGGQIEFESVLVTADEDAWLADTLSEVRVSFSTGSTAAARARGAVCFYAPRCSLMAPRAVVDGQRGNKVTLKPHIPLTADVTAGLMPMAMTWFGGTT